jgi:hypothetical protein
MHVPLANEEVAPVTLQANGGVARADGRGVGGGGRLCTGGADVVGSTDGAFDLEPGGHAVAELLFTGEAEGGVLVRNTGAGGQVGTGGGGATSGNAVDTKTELTGDGHVRLGEGNAGQAGDSESDNFLLHMNFSKKRVGLDNLQ